MDININNTEDLLLYLNKSTENNIKQIIENLGEDVNREGLIKTPLRYSKALKNLTSGYNVNIMDDIKDGIFSTNNSNMITIKNIEFYSLCEHHLLPFFGEISICYIPNNKILGLSKFARISDMYSKRLQIQERLTEEICNKIMEILDAKGVAVFIEASHLCMMMRGICKQNSTTVTTCFTGIFNSNENLKNQFYNIIKK